MQIHNAVRVLGVSILVALGGVASEGQISNGAAAGLFVSPGGDGAAPAANSCGVCSGCCCCANGGGNCYCRSNPGNSSCYFVCGGS